MARRKKSKDGNTWTVLLLLVIVLLAYITPAVLLIGWFFNQIKIRKTKSALKGNYSDFWLDNEEKQTFVTLGNELLHAIQKVKEAEHVAIANKISRNKDGSFSARSKIGKEVRAVIEHYQPVVHSKKSVFFAMSSKPQQQWRAFSNRLGNANSFKYAFYMWLLSFIVAVSYLKIFKSINVYQQHDMLTYVLTGSAVVSAIVYFVCKAKPQVQAEKYTPYPPEVTLENVNSY